MTNNNYQYKNYIALKKMTLVFNDQSSMVIQKDTSNIIGFDIINGTRHYHWGFDHKYMEINSVKLDNDDIAVSCGSNHTMSVFDQLQLNTLFKEIK